MRCQVDHGHLDLELKLRLEDAETGAAEPHTGDQGSRRRGDTGSRLLDGSQEEGAISGPQQMSTGGVGRSSNIEDCGSLTTSSLVGKGVRSHRGKR